MKEDLEEVLIVSYERYHVVTVRTIMHHHYSDPVDWKSMNGMKGHECPNHLSTLAADSFECY
jgi:hypothetical protein